MGGGGTVCREADADRLGPSQTATKHPRAPLHIHTHTRQCTPWQLTGELEALFLLRIQAAARALLAHREVVDARHAAAYKLLCKVRPSIDCF